MVAHRFGNPTTTTKKEREKMTKTWETIKKTQQRS